MDHLRPNTPDVKAGCLIDILQEDFAQSKQTRSWGHLHIDSTDKGLTTSPKHGAHSHSCHFFDSPFKPKGWKVCLSCTYPYHPMSAHPHSMLSPCILPVQYLDAETCSQPHRSQYIKCSQHQIWRCTLLIPVRVRLRQEDCLKVKARLGYRA